MNMKTNKWTKHDDKQLLKMVRQGASREEISKSLGRTPGAISFRKHKIRASEAVETDPSLWSGADIRVLLRMTEEGASASEIGDALGRTRASVRTKRSRLLDKKEEKAEVTKPSEPVNVRDNAKTLASVARQIARSHGKRITMAMFFVEDL
jgi:DNA-binding CsgD family transcriptional regulator